MSFKLAIIGRPNVGKSTLFNRLVGKKLALVDDQPGVTRDRREGEAQLGDLTFTIIDTAGLESGEARSLTGRMRAQTEAAVADADAVLFLIDARVGLTPDDRHFAALLRRAGKPLILIANKAEGRAGEAGALEAYDLGLGEPVPLSAEHGEGLADLYDAIRAALPDKIEPGEDDRRDHRAARARRGRGRLRARSDKAAARRNRRAAECRQINADQPYSRRGAAVDRTGGRYHARLDRA